MTFIDDLNDGVDGVIDADWSIRTGTVVPKTKDIVLRDGAVEVDATYLYADLADSSSLGQKVVDGTSAKVIRSYLNAASRILRHYDGAIRSFDGDRVMAIFIGNAKNTHAVQAALALNWAVVNVLGPQFAAAWPDLSDYWTLSHGIGIDTGNAMLVRGGVRDNNDLVSIGSAPNVAAKLSELRCAHLHITKAVHDVMNKSVQTYDGSSMWANHGTEFEVADSKIAVLWSNWWVSP